MKQRSLILLAVIAMAGCSIDDSIADSTKQKAYLQGKAACELGVPAEANPGDKDTFEAYCWLEGWMDTKAAAAGKPPVAVFIESEAADPQ